ncbi:unnamed protein product [Eruca vesicaria subsp. sativa]|uniref:Uncharacterized protein n=1 Tax=Eruca vesicaria subsp. sativa TaxID=29727 RepID=A0ABC8J9F3_ERUVS|nr:unnamed protein product [Eruca vesicaria subsp. sativa]
MAETTPFKRHREEETLAEEETTKRQKPSYSSYNDQILCLLEDSDELKQPNNDISSFINALQQEISSADDQNAAFSGVSNVEDSSISCVSSKEDDVDDENNEKVMQHLLEASDDELGIPNTGFGESKYDMNKNDINQEYVYGNSLLDGFGDAFWELEDEAANYYTLLQSELFS